MDRTQEESQKPYQVRISSQALKSFEQIIGYITYTMLEPLSAIRVGDEIFKTINCIGRNPFIFRECEKIPTKSKIYRKAVCLSWIIIYKIKHQEIVILDIIHESRQPLRIRSARKIK